LADRELAVRLAATPAILDRLAQKREETGFDPLADLRRAAALEPQNPARWMRLGNAAEWSGDDVLAETCFRRAVDLSNLYQPRYLLAQYYFRRHDRATFERWAQDAFRKSYGDVSPLLDLCRRMQPDGDSFAQQALAAPARLRGQFLTYLVKREESAPAGRLARTLALTATPEDLAPLYGYCDLSLAQGDVSGAETVWNTLCRRGSIPYGSLDASAGASVTNADFERRALAAAFDWHVEAVNGIRIGERPREWRADFSGEEPESCLFAWQYVPLVAGRRYRIEVSAVTVEGSAADGIGWSLFYRSPAGVWKEWIPGSDGLFTAQADIARLALTYRRPWGSARLLGTLALHGVRLEMVR